MLPLGLGMLLLSACTKERLLAVTDPDIVNPVDVASAQAAEALRLGAISRLSDVTGGLQGSGSLNEGIFHFSGALADEWRSTDTFVQRDEVDARAITLTNSAMTLEARGLHRTRVAAIQAIPVLRQWKPENVNDVGQMFWIRGWAEMTIAENFCNGMPISFLDAANNIQYGDPETNVQIYNRALKSFDSATANTVAGARGDTVKWMAAIEKARVLLDLGNYAQAGTTITAAAVPNDFRFTMYYSQQLLDNQIWALNNSAGRWMPANNEGPLGLNPGTANDPRVPICIGNSTACRTFDPTQTRANSFDQSFGSGSFLVQLIWPTRDADINIVTGTEARLIEAEVSLRSGDIVGFRDKLNFLRANFNTFKQQSNPCSATVAISGCPAIPTGGNLLPPLTDPGNQTAREDLLFRERAFWLWGTGHRLADLRRLVRSVADGGFGRTESAVFPSGVHYKGGPYGDDKFLVIPVAEQNNPQYKGCIDRNP